MHFKFEHDFDIDPNGFWDLFFNEEFNVVLYRELKTKDRKVLVNKEENGIVKRDVKLTPERDIPSVFKSLVGDMSYTERDVFDRAKSEMKVIIDPAFLRDRFQLNGLFTVRPLGEGRCHRVFEGDLKISVMLIGGKMEKFILDEMRVSYDTTAVVTRRWIADHKNK